jgi:hypothetical protein
MSKSLLQIFKESLEENNFPTPPNQVIQLPVPIFLTSPSPKSKISEPYTVFDNFVSGFSGLLVLTSWIFIFVFLPLHLTHIFYKSEKYSRYLKNKKYILLYMILVFCWLLTLAFFL